MVKWKRILGTVQKKLFWGEGVSKENGVLYKVKYEENKLISKSQIY
jgi:hypothetical protein